MRELFFRWLKSHLIIQWWADPYVKTANPVIVVKVIAFGRTIASNELVQSPKSLGAWEWKKPE